VCAGLCNYRKSLVSPIYTITIKKELKINQETRQKRKNSQKKKKPAYFIDYNVGYLYNQRRWGMILSTFVETTTYPKSQSTKNRRSKLHKRFVRRVKRLQYYFEGKTL